MKLQNFWLRTLNVRAEEGWVVKRLFLFQFLQGAGIAFFFTAAFALFLARLPITELPYVFIYSSLLLWITGFIYSKIEHAFTTSKLAVIITIFMAVSMLLFRLAFVFVKTDWFLYWMLAWFNVLYLLNSLEFWGVASLLFDARQSKRLFGVISAGDIPAKFIGYTLALFTVEYIGTINLLWAGVLCMVVSIPFLLSIKNSGLLVEIQPRHEKKSHKDEVAGIVKNFSGNLLIRRLAILGIIITGSSILINFAFYAGVKEAYHDDVGLAQFIAFFLAIVRIAALIVKMIFTSRLINRLGLTRSLLITPIVMLILVASIILSQDMPGYQKIIIYFFGATTIVFDILRSSINSPVFLTIMQPLSIHERLRAHTIVKGIMDPFASLGAGIMLLLMIHYQHKLNLLTLSYILLGIAIAWIIGIYRVNSQYLSTIIKTLSSRYFNRDNFSVNDAGTLDSLKEKAKTASEPELINILNMLFHSSNELSGELVLSILQHPSEKVRIAALKLIRQKELPSTRDFLLPLLEPSAHPQILAEIINILSVDPLNSEAISPYIEHPAIIVRQAALSGLLFHGTPDEQHRVENLLGIMITSDHMSDRLMVAEILGNVENAGRTDLILPLMDDHKIPVRKMAMIAAGKSRNTVLIQELINRFHSNEAYVIPPLFIAGEISLPWIVEAVAGTAATQPQKEKLILLCGRIGGPQAQKILLDLLKDKPGEFESVIKALYRTKYVPTSRDQGIFIKVAEKLLHRSAGIIYMQNSFLPHREKYHLLINSLNLELHALRESLLYVFAVLYDRENIKKVRTAYATGKKETIINAMEIIDMSVRKDLGSRFNIIFEPGHITERMHGLRNIYPIQSFQNTSHVLTRILEEESKPFSDWTMACSLYTSKKQKHGIEENLIRRYTVAENLLLRETAFYAL
jgi:ATP/ADP translocase